MTKGQRGREVLINRNFTGVWGVGGGESGGKGGREREREMRANTRDGVHTICLLLITSKTEELK